MENKSGISCKINKLRHFLFRKRAKIKNLYNIAPQLTQDTNGKVTPSQ